MKIFTYKTKRNSLNIYMYKDVDKIIFPVL